MSRRCAARSAGGRIATAARAVRPCCIVQPAFVVRRSAAHRGITLLEVVLSIGLAVAMIGMLFTFYNSTVKDRTESLARSQRLQLARTVIAQMCEEIRQASSFTP